MQLDVAAEKENRSTKRRSGGRSLKRFVLDRRTPFAFTKDDRVHKTMSILSRGKYTSVGEVASIFGVSLPVVREWIKELRIDGTKERVLTRSVEGFFARWKSMDAASRKTENDRVWKKISRGKMEILITALIASASVAAVHAYFLNRIKAMIKESSDQFSKEIMSAIERGHGLEPLLVEEFKKLNEQMKQGMDDRLELMLDCARIDSKKEQEIKANMLSTVKLIRILGEGQVRVSDVAKKTLQLTESIKAQIEEAIDGYIHRNTH